MFVLGQHSIDKLVGVHPDLVAIVKKAIGISPVDFSVIEGLRTSSREKTLVAKGASTTMHSRHLPNKQGFGCAIDIAAFVNGKLLWEPVTLYERIAHAMKAAADSMNIPIGWGGDWQNFKDWGHYQLPWAEYP